MLSKRAAEVLTSVYREPDDWRPLSLPKTSQTLLNSSIIHTNWVDLSDKSINLVVLYRKSDKSCLVFKKTGKDFSVLPALFTLDSTLTLLDLIEDVEELLQLERLVIRLDWFTKVFWSLK